MVFECRIGSLTSSASNETTARSSGQVAPPAPRVPSRNTLLVMVALEPLRCSALSARLGPAPGPKTAHVGPVTRLASRVGELSVRSTATPSELEGLPVVMAPAEMVLRWMVPQPFLVHDTPTPAMVVRRAGTMV